MLSPVYIYFNDGDIQNQGKRIVLRRADNEIQEDETQRVGARDKDARGALEDEKAN